MNKPFVLTVEDDTSIRNLITTALKTNDYFYFISKVNRWQKTE